MASVTGSRQPAGGAGGRPSGAPISAAPCPSATGCRRWTATRDGIAIAADAIRLDGGSIKAADGTTDALLTHAVVAAAPDHQVDGGLVTLPTVTALAIASRPRGGTAYGRGEAIVVEVGFSEPVTVTGAPQLALTVGGAARSAGFVRSAGRSLWFRYRAENDLDDDGIGIAAGALALNGGSIRDRTGNDARLDLGANAVANAAGRSTPRSWTRSAPAVSRRRGDLRTPERQHLRARRNDRDRGPLQRSG